MCVEEEEEGGEEQIKGHKKGVTVQKCSNLAFSSKTGVLMATAPWRLKHLVMVENTLSLMAIWKGS